jgi:predicted RNA-binding Zn-ribbon protein involved in translation (DUF1610 family)
MAQLIPLDKSRENLTLAEENPKEDYKNGFACPNCGEELYDDANAGILESMPAQKEVICKNKNKCGFRGTRYVANVD